jgi:hypothetical protein
MSVSRCGNLWLVELDGRVDTHGCKIIDSWLSSLDGYQGYCYSYFTETFTAKCATAESAERAKDVMKANTE